MRIYVINIEAYKGKDRAKIPYFALISYYLVSFAALRVYFAKWRLQFSHLPKVTIRKSDIFCAFSSFFSEKVLSVRKMFVPLHRNQETKDALLDKENL